MANKSVFGPASGRGSAVADSVNEAGGRAYTLPPKHALAQFAATGCLNDTFYTKAEDQLAAVLDLCNQVEPKFIAQVAVYSRDASNMKDMPALLLAILSTKDSALFAKIFNRVIDTPKMLRNFVQIIRSGVVGRKSLGTGPKRCVQRWLANRSPEQIFRGSIGETPSMADLIRLSHACPRGNKEKTALYAYLLDREYRAKDLPKLVREYEDFKKDPTGEIPEVPMEMLTSFPLTAEQWTSLAENMSWTQLRMNLNTLARHDVFKDRKAVKAVAARLRDADEIRKSKCFPYQLLIAYKETADVPSEISDALQDAMEIATENVPEIDGKVWIFPDVSGSMSSPITGKRDGSTSKVRCIDVAALIASSLLRTNPAASVRAFAGEVVSLRLNARDSVMTNADKLAGIGGGATTCSAPLRGLNEINEKGDLIVYISDYESWMDYQKTYRRDTCTQQEWETFKRRNPKAKMVCIDLTPQMTVQAQDDKSVMNIAGFSDSVFGVIERFVSGRKNSASHWVDVIEKFE